MESGESVSSIYRESLRFERTKDEISFCYVSDQSVELELRCLNECGITRPGGVAWSDEYVLYGLSGDDNRPERPNIRSNSKILPLLEEKSVQNSYKNENFLSEQLAFEFLSVHLPRSGENDQLRLRTSDEIFAQWTDKGRTKGGNETQREILMAKKGTWILTVSLCPPQLPSEANDARQRTAERTFMDHQLKEDRRVRSRSTVT